MVGVPYSSLVGRLLFLENCTRPDIATVARMAHWEVAKRLLRCVKGSVGNGLVHVCGENAPWEYNDISYSSDPETRRG